MTDKVEGNSYNPQFMKDMVFELTNSIYYSVLIFIVYNGNFNEMIMWNAFALRNVR